MKEESLSASVAKGVAKAAEGGKLNQRIIKLLDKVSSFFSKGKSGKRILNCKLPRLTKSMKRH